MLDQSKRPNQLGMYRCFGKPIQTSFDFHYLYLNSLLLNYFFQFLEQRDIAQLRFDIFLGHVET